MKEPSSYFRHKRPQKLKLICSFNGAFQLRPHSGKVRYVGGETRIVSLDRKIGILQLVSKISQLCPSLPCFSIKYQLRNGSNGREKDTPQPTPLVSVVTDEDVRFMIEEYDQLEADCKHARLWVFVCANGYDQDSSAFSSVFWNSNFVGNRYLGNVDLSDGLQPNLNTTLVGKIGNCDDTTKKIESKSQNFAIHAAEIRNYDNPFEESVSTLQNPSGAHNFGGLILDYKAPNPHFNGNVAALSPTLDSQLHGSAIRGGNYGIYYQSGPMPQSNVLPVSSGLSVGNLIPSLGSQFHGLDGFSDGLVNGGENYGICNQSGPTPQPTSALPVSSDLSVNEVQRNLEHELMGNLNGENVRTYCDNEQIGSAPEFSHSQLLGRVSPVVDSSVTSNRNNLQGRFRNQRTSCEEVRNQRTSSYHMRSTTSYHMRNHRTNLAGIGNNNNNETDGKVCPGKCYPGLKACSSILKHGQLMRSHYTHLWKSWTTAREGKGKMESTMSTQPSSPHKNYEGISDEQEMQNVDGRRPLDDIRTQGGLLAGEFERPNSSINYLDLQGLGLPFTITRNPFSSLEKLNMPEETFSSSNQVNCKSKAEPLVRNLSDAHNGCHSIPANDQSSDLVSKKETSSMGAQKNFCMEPDNKGAVKSSANDHNVVGTLSGVVTSLLNLSLYNLSLSSFEGASPSASSSLTSNDVSKSLSMCEMGAQPSPPDIMDEGHFSSGPPIDKLSMDNFSSSIDCVSDMEKNISPSKGNQKSTPSSLRVHEKADTNGSDTSPKLLDRICNDLIKFYDHLATRELQTIKSSDLEDIKELGSGTYGTVFYGKWKGSDVAIKRLKPNCFTGGELEKDRLIADFWKEAHIIAQLHHPNVVSFYGVVTDGPVTNLATVTEYMVNGSLKQVLQRKDRTIDRRKRIILAMDAAFGMEYLHEKNIVHFDLKSHNFLVNMKDPQRPVCKIGDMGLSKVKQRTLVSGGVRGTIPWMAPELLTSKKTMVTEKVDVYSFGIVMWELLTGEEPYHDLRTEETIAGIIKGDLRPDVPSWCDPTWRSLMERCWSSDPVLRPSFSEIARELRSMAATMNIK